MLINCLTAVSALAYSTPERIPIVIDYITTLLQCRLAPRSNPEWTLNDEMQVIRSLVALDNLRFGSELKWEERIYPDALLCHIPELILQPLVENALKYGRHASGIPCVSFLANVSENQLFVTITNPATVAGNEKVDRGLGIGISNIRNRLDILYGSQADLQIEFHSHQATSVLKLPLLKQP